MLTDKTKPAQPSRLRRLLCVAELSKPGRCRAVFPAPLPASDIPRCWCRPERRSGSGDTARNRGCPVRPATSRNTARSAHVRVGLQRALIPDLRNLVVAEFAIGVTDQIRHIGTVVLAERLQLLDRRAVVVAVVNRGIGRAIALKEFRIVDAGALVLLLLYFLGVLGVRCRR